MEDFNLEECALALHEDVDNEEKQGKVHEPSPK